ncbi:Na+/H+ antiporter NhaC, partial [Lactiplantibacillus plantarum]|nr:Na+/H+ antiporter NhaC [Lactiplantibacillus plantarum]
VSLVLYAVLGAGAATQSHLGKIQTTLTVLNNNFTISWWAALPLVVMVACALLKIPAIATLLMNIRLAIVMIFIEHPHSALPKIATMIETGFVAKTGNAGVDALLSRGGFCAMMSTV